LLVQFAPDQVKPERQALPVEPARNAHRRQARQAGRDREHVVQIHGDRIVALLADAERSRA
jgi:translation initiation factor IF-1